MYISNQLNDPASQQKLSFSPVLSKVSNMGTTVTYGIQSLNSVNAANANIPVSGNFYNAGLAGYQTGWNQTGYNQFAYNQAPLINAGLTNQYASGNFNYFQNQLGQAILAQPTVDISETTSDVVVAAYIPNVALNDISLSVTDNSVTISAAAWTGSQNVAFNRTVALPTSIRSESVDASLQSGILEIRLPKAEKAVRKRNTVNQDAISQK